MERILLTSEILSLRQTLREKLKQVEKGPLKLEIEPDILDKIIFERSEGYYSGYDFIEQIRKTFAIHFSLIKKLDLTGISFENVDVSNCNFANSFGVTIDPQKVYRKDLSETKLKDVTLDGSFDGCIVRATDFSGSKNAIIYPELVLQGDIRGTNFKDAEVRVINSFDKCTKDEQTSLKGATIIQDGYFDYLETKIRSARSRKRN